MADNLPDNLSDVEDEYIVGEDSRAMQLTHYVLAERLLQVEYAEIMRQHREEKDSQSLIYILEGGFRGFHKMTAGEYGVNGKMVLRTSGMSCIRTMNYLGRHMKMIPFTS